MTAEVFYAYLENVFHPFLIANDIKLPVALFVDGFSGHMSLDISNFCEEHGIILYNLYPNATHIQQPMDIGCFKPLKNTWTSMVNKRRVRNTNPMQFQDFVNTVSEAVKQTLTPGILKSSFRAAGLFPFDDCAVDYQRLVSAQEQQDDTSIATKPKENSVEEMGLAYIEALMQPNDVLCFYRIYTATDLKPAQHLAGLYHVWKKAKEAVELRKSSCIEQEEEFEELSLDVVNGNDLHPGETINVLASNIPVGSKVEIEADDNEVAEEQNDDANESTNGNSDHSYSFK